MGRKAIWFTCGSARVTHRKTGKSGVVEKFTGKEKAERLLIKWDEGGSGWVNRKEIRPEKRS